jgi:hypothetical protein
LLGACSTDRPTGNARTAVPNDMPGARNSSAVSGGTGAIEIAQPLPGTVVTNTITVLATAVAGAEEYHVGLVAGGRYIVEDTVTRDSQHASGVFSVTLRFEPVPAPADGAVTIWTVPGKNGEAAQPASVPVKLAPAGVMAINGPVIHLSPDSGKAGTNVAVIGEHFPPGQPVEIRLSGVSTEATEHAYASGRIEPTGEFKLTFTMPAYWPNGDPIVSPEVLVVASTPDFVSKATAVFGYSSVAAPEPPTPQPARSSASGAVNTQNP